MRVVVAAIGSRGDVVPCAHLAARFASSGHEVTLVTHRSFARLVDPSVRMVCVPSEPRALMAGPAARAVRRGNLRELNRTRHLFADFIHSALEPTREALPGADVLVASTFAIAAVDQALLQSVPVVRAHMWPEYPGLGGPIPLLPYGWLAPTPVRRLAWRALRRAEPYLGGVEGWWQRGRLHLIARHPVGLTTASAGSLYAFSPHIAADLPDHGTVTGWWTSPDTSSALSAETAAALASGDDWVYAGFGSMDQGDPDELLEQLAAACARVGVRAIVQVGDSRGVAHPNVLCVGEEPHDELFRRVRAVVHHGGAGTTGTVVRAGVPSVVVPHFADQFYWGSRLHALGVAARPVSRAFMSEHVLTRLIDDALAPVVRQRALCLAERVRSEDGCGLAVQHIEQSLAGAGRR